MFSRQRLTVNNKDTDIITDIDKIFFFSVGRYVRIYSYSLRLRFKRGFASSKSNLFRKFGRGYITNFPSLSTESLLRKIIVQILASSKFAHGTIQGRFRDRYVESGSKSCKGLRPLPPSLWLASSDVSRGATRIRDEDNIRGASRYRRGPKFRYGPTSKPRHPSRRGRTALTWMSPPLSVPPLIGHRSAPSSTYASARA